MISKAQSNLCLFVFIILYLVLCLLAMGEVKMPYVEAVDIMEEPVDWYPIELSERSREETCWEIDEVAMEVVELEMELKSAGVLGR